MLLNFTLKDSRMEPTSSADLTLLWVSIIFVIFLSKIIYLCFLFASWGVASRMRQVMFSG